MNNHNRPALLRTLLATSLIVLSAPAMSESFLDKLKKAKDSIERGSDETRRTLDDIAELGSTGKGKKSKSGDSGDGAAQSESTTMKTVNAGDAQLSDGPATELRAQVGRMGTACRERSAEGESFTSCASVCGDAAQKISSSAKGSANDDAHAACTARYNQAMGLESPAAAGSAAQPPPAKVESGISAMPGG
jgi:hypothetical protein